MSWLFGIDAIFESCAGIDHAPIDHKETSYDTSSQNDGKEYNIWGQRTDEGAKKDSDDSSSDHWW